MGLVSLNDVKLRLSVGKTDSSSIAASPGGAVQSGTTVTITTTVPHQLAAGQLVTIAGLSQSGLNGVFPVLAIPTVTTFTYSAPAGFAGDGGGTAVGPLDGSLLQLIDQQSAKIEAAMNRKIAQATYTEIIEGNGEPYLPLAQRPAQSITSLWLDNQAAYGTSSGAFGAATLLVSGQDYALLPDGSGLIERICGVWDRPLDYHPGVISGVPERVWGNVKVIYVAGYAVIPSDIQEAVMTMVGITRALAKFGQSSGDTQFSPPARPQSAFPREVADTIGRYKTWSI